MRTTLTIDDDVAFALRKAQESEPKKPFKEIINETLRRGLQSPPKKKRYPPFKVRSMNLGLREDLNFDNIEELLDIVEGPDRR
ncbi:MAG: DUF2191 domain-containing protein [Acidobacteria bacterium]|nr:DUF2191 domain-containing protein [Acidobacteriota bacterium]